MTEKIREGIAKRQCLIEHIGYNQMCKDYKPDMEFLWKEHYLYQNEYLKGADIFIAFLHSIGVVMLDEGEIPKEYNIKEDSLEYVRGYNHCIGAAYQAGYKRTKPLVEVKVEDKV